MCSGIGALQKMNLASATNKESVVHPLHPVENLVSADINWAYGRFNESHLLLFL